MTAFQLARFSHVLFLSLALGGFASHAFPQSVQAPAQNGLAPSASPGPAIVESHTDCTVLLDQQPDGLTSYFSDRTCPVCPSGASVIAENVIFDTPVSICELQVWGGYFGGLPIGDDFTLRIHSGWPGSSPVYEEQGISSTRTGTGLVVLGLAEYSYTLTLAAGIVVAPGQYYFELYNNTNLPGTQWAWETGVAPMPNTTPSYLFASSAPGVSWMTGSAEEMAFVIRGVDATNSGHPYCFGDSTGANCPCSAFGAAGQGCANTAGIGAVLIGSGEASLGADTLQFDVSGVPGQKAGLLLRGNNQVAVPAGDGILCTAGSSLRSQVQTTVAGTTQYTNFHGSGFGQVANVGSATNFQFWYRDPSNPCSGAGFNFTNGWTVTYGP